MAIKVNIPGQSIKESVPCQIVEKGFLSSLHTIYYLVAFVITVIVVFWFVRLFKLSPAPRFGTVESKSKGGWG